MTSFDNLKQLQKENCENTAEMRALAEEHLNGSYHPRVKDHFKTQLLYVEAQEQLDRLHAEWIANPALPLVEEAHPEFMARHQRLQQLRDESWEALVADGYVEGEE